MKRRKNVLVGYLINVNKAGQVQKHYSYLFIFLIALYSKYKEIINILCNNDLYSDSKNMRLTIFGYFLSVGDKLQTSV